MILDPIVGCIVPERLTFEQRVNGYARWIGDHPLQAIHFYFPHLSAGFISEAKWAKV
jgi:hypothetical protein